MFASALLALAATTANAASFDGYTDESNFARDNSSSVFTIDEAEFITFEDAPAVQVMVSYGKSSEGLLLLSEDECDGSYFSGCLNGYRVLAAAALDDVKAGRDELSASFDVYLYDGEGLSKAAEVDSHVSMEVDGTITTIGDVILPDGSVLGTLEASTEDGGLEDLLWEIAKGVLGGGGGGGDITITVNVGNDVEIENSGNSTPEDNKEDNEPNTGTCPTGDGAADGTGSGTDSGTAP